MEIEFLGCKKSQFVIKLLYSLKMAENMKPKIQMKNLCLKFMLTAT